MYASREHTIAALAAVVGVSRATLYRALGVPAPPMSETPARRDPKSTAVAERRDPKPMTWRRRWRSDTPGFAYRQARTWPGARVTCQV